MSIYRAGAISDDLYTARDVAGAVVEVANIGIDAPAALNVGLGIFEAGVGHHFTVKPDATLVGTNGELVVTGTDWRDVIGYEVTDVGAPYYGSLAGVSEILAAVVKGGITEDFTITASAVSAELASITLVTNARLAAAGYLTPVIAVIALPLLDRAANLACAATVLERLMMAAAPTPDRVSVASVWRRESRDIIDGACDGTMPLPGAITAGATGIVSDLPSVTSRVSALPSEDTADFVEDYGGQNRGI